MAEDFYFALVCESCDNEFPCDSLRTSSANGVCPMCLDTRWSAKAQISKTSTDYHLAENIVGIGLAVTLGVGFTVDPSETKLTKDFVLEGLSLERAIELIHMENNRVRIRMFLEEIKEQRERKVAEYKAFTAENTVDCHLCRSPFTPEAMLEKQQFFVRDAFSSNIYCSEECEITGQAARSESLCGRCHKTFKIPQKSGHFAAAPKKWHLSGFCSAECLNSKKKLGCRSCHKLYLVSQMNFLPVHKELIAIQESGYCSKRCKERAGNSVAEKKTPAKQFGVKCRAGHVTRIPATHFGHKYFCEPCHAIFTVPTPMKSANS